MSIYQDCLAAVMRAAPKLTEREVHALFEELERSRQAKLDSGEARDLADATERAARELEEQARSGEIDLRADEGVSHAAGRPDLAATQGELIAMASIAADSRLGSAERAAAAAFIRADPLERHPSRGRDYGEALLALAKCAARLEV